MGVKTVEEYKALSQALINMIDKYGPYITIAIIKTLNTDDDISVIIKCLE